MDFFCKVYLEKVLNNCHVFSKKGKMSKNVKSSRSFSELVNTKIEPIIQSDWIIKIGSKGKLKKRFFVTTYSALYVCKATGLWQKLKFNHVYPWVDLDKINVIAQNSLVFQFDSKIIRFKVSEASNWISPTAAYLSQFLPENHKAKIEIQNEYTQNSFTSSSLFIDLFISCCISLGVRPDVHWCSAKKKELRNNEILDLLDIDYNPKIISAICRALSLVRNVPSVTIGGHKFVSLFSSLSSILQSNQTIANLTIINYRNPDGFASFVRSLTSKELVEVKFKNVKFSVDMIEKMSTIKVGQNLETIVFSSCNLGTDELNSLFRQVDSFRGLKCLIFKKDENEWPDEQLINVMKFASESLIETLVLKDMEINITKILEISSDRGYSIKCLDLSKNFCHPTTRPNLVFNQSLENLVLKGVKWFDNSLCQFISMQPFGRSVKCDFSYAKFSETSPANKLACLAEKPSSRFMESIVWKRNPVSTKFFEFLANFESLHEAILDNCPINPGDEETILPAISDFIKSTKLTKLSLSSTLRVFKENGLIVLKSALAHHEYLRSFNYSNNLIGDRGLLVLRDILLENETISKLNFSGANLFDPNNFLEFLRSTHELTTLCHVTKPKRDIAFLLSRSSKNVENEIDKLWEHLSENTARNTKMHDMEMMQSMNSGFMSTNESSSFFESSQEIVPKVTWELNIDINYSPQLNEWDNLKKKFTFENITGVTKPIIFEATRNDQFDLIDLDPL